jgi:hypothetical protein
VGVKMIAENRKIFRRVIEYFRQDGNIPLLISVSLHKYFNRINFNVGKDVQGWIDDWLAFAIEDHEKILEKLNSIKNNDMKDLQKLSDIDFKRLKYYIDYKDLQLTHSCPSCGESRKYSSQNSYLVSLRRKQLCKKCGAQKRIIRKQIKNELKDSPVHNKFSCSQCNILMYLTNEELRQAVIYDTLCDDCVNKNRATLGDGKYLIPTVKCKLCNKEKTFRNFKNAFAHARKHKFTCGECKIEIKKTKSKPVVMQRGTNNIRNCPDCKKEIKYKTNSRRNLANKRNCSCVDCANKKKRKTKFNFA